ncbi:MAG: fatty acyl-AMP ligase, partial [Alphaproteobacteria bacterium]
VGRIFVRGPSIMAGYFNDPEATRGALKDGWLDTGDMGYFRDGHLYVVGRAKDMIIVRGRNHWPQDLEWAAETADGLRSGDTAAVSLPGPDGEEVPAVLVQCRVREEEARRALAEAVKRAVQQGVGITCSILLVPPRSLPRTSSGKLSRSKARRQVLAGELPVLLRID